MMIQPDTATPGYQTATASEADVQEDDTRKTHEPEFLPDSALSSLARAGETSRQPTV